MTHIHRLLLVLPLALAAQAQDLPLAALRIPVHGGTAAHAPDYGLWTAGPGFKASFHDGFAFYPELGTSCPEDLPFVWRTVGVDAAGAVLPLATPHVRASDWRVTLDQPGWREVYDVRAGGVEQSFVIDQRPAGAGDLVIRGRVETRLLAATVRRGHQELAFRDAAGRPIVGYGAAFAIDATGRRTKADTTFDGDLITLTVDAAWLQDAAYPVTVDPLITPVVINQGATAGAISSVDVCTGGSGLDTMTVYTRAFSASDHDVFAILSQPDFSGALPIYGDLTRGSNDRNVTVAVVQGAANRWIVGFDRVVAPATLPRLSLYFHNRLNTTFNSGIRLQGPVGSHPDLGGAVVLGPVLNTGLLVYEFETQPGSPNTHVVAQLIDAENRLFGSNAFEVGGYPAGTTYDRERPSVSQTARDGDSWHVVWQELNRVVPGSHWTVQATRITAYGQTVHSWPVATSGTDDLIEPEVAGTGGRFLTTYLRRQSQAVRLEAVKTTWAGFPVAGAPRTLASAIPPLSGLSNQRLAHDHQSGAFFAATWLHGSQVSGREMAWSAQIARLSLNGFVTETATLFAATVPGPVAVAAGVTSSVDRFPAVYATNDTSHTLRGTQLQHPADATALRYGTACGSALINGLGPWAGNQLFRVTISGARTSVPTILFLGVGAGAVPLDGLGMTGCTFLLDPTQFFLTLTGITDVTGAGAITIPLPDDPLLRGDLYFQYFHVALLANPASLLTTAGLRAQVR